MEEETRVNTDAEEPVKAEETPSAEAGEAEEPVPAPAAAGDLNEQIAALNKQVQTNLEGWQRSRAEFINYKKRIEREMKETRERAASDALTKILPLFDDFDRALNNIPEDLAGHPWIGGTSLILRKFEKLLDEFAITPIDPVGEPFDPHLHEAVGMDSDTEFASGTVTATLQKGYISGERVLRPALVRVAS